MKGPVLTHRERVLTALSCREPDRVPCELYLSPAIKVALQKATGSEDLDAVNWRLLQDAMSDKVGYLNRAPLSVRYYSLPTAERPLTLDDAARVRDWIAGGLPHDVGIPIRSIFMEVESPLVDLRPLPDASGRQAEPLLTTRIICVGADLVAAARVGDYPARLTSGNAAARQLRALAIDRLDLASDADYRADFRPSLGVLLNQSGSQAGGVLLLPPGLRRGAQPALCAAADHGHEPLRGAGR